MICDYQTNKVYLAEGIKGYPRVAENLLNALYKEGIETEYLPFRRVSNVMSVFIVLYYYP